MYPSNISSGFGVDVEKSWSPENAVLASFSDSFVDNFIGSFNVAFCGMSAVDRFNAADWLDKLSMLLELLWIVEEDRL